jgi:hypothetical protein
MSFTSSTPTNKSHTATTVARTTQVTRTAATSQSSNGTPARTVDNPDPAAQPSPLAATPATPVTVVSVPSSLDSQFQNLAPVPNTGWANQQPVWPTVWPPVPLPGPELDYAGQQTFRTWVANMAVLPYVNDPPPGPRTVSRYPGLTTN